MYITYILQNSITGRRYIGSTCDIERRLSEHNRGQTKSTNQTGIWKIIYAESFNSQSEAKNREKVIKSYKGGNALKRLLRE